MMSVQFHSRPINRRISGEGHAERSSASVSNSLRMWPGAWPLITCSMASPFVGRLGRRRTGFGR